MARLLSASEGPTQHLANPAVPLPLPPPLPPPPVHPGPRPLPPRPRSPGGSEADRLERQLTLAGLGASPEFEQAQARGLGCCAAAGRPPNSSACQLALHLHTRSLGLEPFNTDGCSPLQNMTVFPPAKHDALGLEVRGVPAGGGAAPNSCLQQRLPTAALPIRRPAQHLPACHGWHPLLLSIHPLPLSLQDLLTPEEREVRDRVRRFAVGTPPACTRAGRAAVAGSRLCRRTLARATAPPPLGLHPLALTLAPAHPCPPLALPQEQEIAPVIAGYWEKAEFPFPLVPGFQARPAVLRFASAAAAGGHALQGVLRFACAASAGLAATLVASPARCHAGCLPGTAPVLPWLPLP